MKASFKFILAALAATAVSVSCTKDVTPDFENDKVNPAAEGSRVIAVSFGSQTKTYLDEDGLQPKFVDNDSILISNGDAIDTCEVKVESEVATISTNLTGPLTAVYPYKAAGMNSGNPKQIDTVLVSTVQSGKFADANICMARMTGENEESLSFENKTAVFCIKPPTNSPGYVEVSAEGFNIANNIPEESAFTDYSTIRVPSVNADSVYVSILALDGLKVNNLKFSDGTQEKAITTGARATEAIKAGTLYTVTATEWKSPEADIPDGALKGVFSVSADKQVYFSQGNLWADDLNALHFESNQYSSASSWDASHVSHFTWSSTVEAAVGDSNSGDNLFCDESHKVSVDGGDAIYYALSKDEWSYLFNTRSNASNLYKYGVTVCGKTNCVVLLPDNWEWDETADEHNVGTGWQNGGYPETQTGNEVTWEKMEKAGAVCLPAAGGRGGSIVDSVGGYGYYWSSTAGDSDRACHVRFSSYFVSPDNLGYRDNGYSVRLVTNVSAAPTPTEPDYVVMKANVEGTKTLKWATKNLGAATETDFGKYFGWGDKTGYALTSTAAASPFDGSTVNNAFEGAHSFSTKPSIDGETQNPTTLPVSNDAARINWGGDWRMPTKEDFKNLYEARGGTSIPQSGGSTSTTEKGVYWCANYDGVAGCLFCDGTNKLFFPAAGYGNSTDLRNAGSSGYYWSSSLNTGTTVYAYHLYFRLGSVAPQFNDYRYGGFSVRPVSDK